MRTWMILGSSAALLLDNSPPTFVFGWISSNGTFRSSWISQRHNNNNYDGRTPPATRVELPAAAAADNDDNNNNNAATARSGTTSSSSPSILVVDDEEAIRNAVGTLLQDHGFTVCLCPDATTALERMQISSFDCIVSDVRMSPGLSGLDLVQTIRTIESCQTIPVVLLTAAGRPHERIAGYQAGADAYLPKPFDPTELVAIITRLIDRRISMTTIQDELAVITNALLLQQQQVQQLQQRPTVSSSTNTTTATTIHLPPDEAQVLAYVCEGWTTKEIAAKVYLSTRRIDQLLTVLFRKANVKNRTELVRWAVSTGLVKLS